MKNRDVILVLGLVMLLLWISVPLMANGDSPRAVYDLYITTQRAGDVDGMAGYVTKAKVDQLKAMPEAQKKQIGEMMKSMAPLEYIVIKEDIRGDTAILTLKGKATDFAGGSREQEGTARFVKENGVWKLDEESWQETSSQ
ncbi:MAG: hypothetical protein RAO92_04410 [Candidatus Euphemobacter frigidus]|nr:hypothetical protein [Candidatus Euphemobacter frigidus]MDP8275629.1 hypothetical protein [Candidatus Euphemobacter frigidus]